MAILPRRVKNTDARRRLAQKIEAASRGEEVEFKPYEFLFYIVLRQGIDDRELSHRLGYTDTRLSESLHNNHWTITYYAAHKMAHMTGKSFEFWSKHTYTTKDAEGVVIDMSKDATYVAEPPIGSHQARLKRIRKQEAEEIEHQRGSGI